MEVAGLATVKIGIDDTQLRRGLERGRQATGKFETDATRGYRRASQAANQFGASATGAAARAANANSQVITSANGVAASYGKIISLARGWVGAMGAIFGARAIANTLGNFEGSMAKVAAVSQATGDTLGDLRDIAQELGATTEFSAIQAANGLLFLSRAGWTAEQSISALPGVLDLATAGALDLGAAADIASNIMSGFAIGAERASEVGDVLAGAASRANTTVSQLGEAMKFVAPIGAALGITMSDAAAAIGVLSDAGLQGGMAGTGLRRVLSSLASTTPAVEAVFAKMGVTMEELDPQLNSIVEIVGRLDKAGLSAADALEIFGDRGAPAILALISAGDKLQTLTSTLQEIEGESARMATVMRDNLAGSFKSVGSAAESLVLSFGEAGLTATIRALTDSLTFVLRGLANNIEIIIVALTALAAKFLAPAIIGAAATFAAWAASGARVVAVIVGINGGLTIATVRMLAFNAAAAAGSRILAFFGGWVGAAIAAVAVGLTLWATRTKQVTAATQETVSAVEELEARYRSTTQAVIALTVEELTRLLAAKNAALQEAEATANAARRSESLGGMAMRHVVDTYGSLAFLFGSVGQDISHLNQSLSLGSVGLLEYAFALESIGAANPAVAGVTQALLDLLAPQIEVQRQAKILAGEVEELGQTLDDAKAAANGAAVAIATTGNVVSASTDQFFTAVGAVSGYATALRSLQGIIVPDNISDRDFAMANLVAGTEALAAAARAGEISAGAFLEGHAEIYRVYQQELTEIASEEAGIRKDILESTEMTSHLNRLDQIDPLQASIRRLTNEYYINEVAMRANNATQSELNELSRNYGIELETLHVAAAEAAGAIAGIGDVAGATTSQFLAALESVSGYAAALRTIQGIAVPTVSDRDLAASSLAVGMEALTAAARAGEINAGAFLVGRKEIYRVHEQEVTEIATAEARNRADLLDRLEHEAYQNRLQITDAHAASQNALTHAFMARRKEMEAQGAPQADINRLMSIYTTESETLRRSAENAAGAIAGAANAAGASTSQFLAAIDAVSGYSNALQTIQGIVVPTVSDRDLALSNLVSGREALAAAARAGEISAGAFLVGQKEIYRTYEQEVTEIAANEAKNRADILDRTAFEASQNRLQLTDTLAAAENALAQKYSVLRTEMEANGATLAELNELSNTYGTELETVRMRAEAAAGAITGAGNAVGASTSQFLDAIGAVSGYASALQTIQGIVVPTVSDRDLAASSLVSGREALAAAARAGEISAGAFLEGNKELYRAYEQTKTEIADKESKIRADILERTGMTAHLNLLSQTDAQAASIQRLTNEYKINEAAMRANGATLAELNELSNTHALEVETVRTRFAGSETGGGTVPTSSALATEIELVSQSIAKLKLEGAVLGMTAADAAAYKTERELINAAIQQGMPLSATDITLIKETSMAYGEATAALQAQQEAVAADQERMESWQETSKSFVGTFISGMRQGQSAAESLGNSLGKLADRLIDMALDSAIQGLFDSLSSMGGGGGLFGGAGGGNDGGGGNFPILGALFGSKHAGGVVGAASGPQRTLPASTLLGAPRLHNGLAADEFAAILQKGERVIPKNAANANTMPPSINIVTNIDARGSQMSENDFRQIVDENNKRIAESMPGVLRRHSLNRRF